MMDQGSLLLSIFFVPSVLVLSFIIFLASIGKSFGVRRLYIAILLKVFEWGRLKIELHENTHKAEEDDQENANHPNGDTVRVIEKESKKSMQDIKNDFQLSDAMYFCKSGIEAIIEDDVTQRFSAAELASWNLLTRTNTTHHFVSYRLTILWFIGFVLRYFILLPFRFILAVFAIGGLITGNAIVGSLPEGRFKKICYYRISVTCYRIMSRAFSAVIKFHDKHNKAKGGGICVANHTSPIDIIILGCDNCYAMVGQAQGGLMGFIQRSMSRAESHIWFQRSESKDRLAVARRLREHVEDKNKLPILIFPEGTCINNTSIMMFKKGSFEVGGMIYPVAIKYDSKFSDAFWNSSIHSLSTHLLMILTSWALVCDVWYLPPEKQKEGENAVQFANRIKAEIARKGGLVDLEWDGQLKRDRVKPNLKEKQQEVYSRILKSD